MASRTRTYKKKKAGMQAPDVSTAPARGMFYPRLFEVESQQSASQQPLDLNTALRRSQRYGHNLSQMQFAESSGTSVQPEMREQHLPFQRVTTPALQAKLTVGEPRDRYEREADRANPQVDQQIDALEPQQSDDNAWLGELASPLSFSPDLALKLSSEQVAAEGREILEKLNRLETQVIVEGFKDRTNKGTFKRRGNIFKTIDDLLDRYSTAKEQNERQEVLGLIDELCETWKTKYQLFSSTPEAGRDANTITIVSIYEYLANVVQPWANEQTKHLPADLPDRQDFDTNEIDSHKQKKKKTKDKAENTIQEYKSKFEGDTGKFFGTVIPNMMDLMVPDTGDKGKFEVQVRFPVKFGFVGGRFTYTAERKEEKELKVNFEGTFQLGGNAGVAALGGELGCSSEVVAKDSTNAGKLLSYGLYRRFRESQTMPREIANQLWGGQVSTGGYAMAENWAAQVEKDVFNEEKDGKFTDAAKKSYIELGGTGAFLSDYGLGPVSNKTNAQGYEGRRFSQYTLDRTRREKDKPEDLKTKQGSGVGQQEYVPGRGAQKTKGQGSHRMVISHSSSLSAGGVGVSGGIKLKLDVMSNPGSHYRDLQVNKWEVELEEKTKVPGSLLAKRGLASAVVSPLAMGGVNLIHSFSPQVQGAIEKAAGKTKENTQKLKETYKKIFKKTKAQSETVPDETELANLTPEPEQTSVPPKTAQTNDTQTHASPAASGKKKTYSQLAGEFLHPLTDLATQLPQNISLTKTGKSPLETSGIEGSLNFGLNIKGGKEAKPDDQTVMDNFKAEGAILKISNTTIKLPTGVNNSQVSFEGSKRLAQMKYQYGKKLKVEFLGQTIKEYEKVDKQDDAGNAVKDKDDETVREWKKK